MPVLSVACFPTAMRKHLQLQPEILPEMKGGDPTKNQSSGNRNNKLAGKQADRQLGYTEISTDRQTDRQQTDRQTDNRQTDRQQTDRQQRQTTDTQRQLNNLLYFNLHISLATLFSESPSGSLSSVMTDPKSHSFSERPGHF